MMSLSYTGGTFLHVNGHVGGGTCGHGAGRALDGGAAGRSPLSPAPGDQATAAMGSRTELSAV